MEVTWDQPGLQSLLTLKPPSGHVGYCTSCSRRAPPTAAKLSQWHPPLLEQLVQWVGKRFKAGQSQSCPEIFSQSELEKSSPFFP